MLDYTYSFTPLFVIDYRHFRFERHCRSMPHAITIYAPPIFDATPPLLLPPTRYYAYMPRYVYDYATPYTLLHWFTMFSPPPLRLCRCLDVFIYAIPYFDIALLRQRRYTPLIITLSHRCGHCRHYVRSLLRWLDAALVTLTLLLRYLTFFAIVTPAPRHCRFTIHIRCCFRYIDTPPER